MHRIATSVTRAACQSAGQRAGHSHCASWPAVPAMQSQCSRSTRACARDRRYFRGRRWHFAGRRCAHRASSTDSKGPVVPPSRRAPPCRFRRGRPAPSPSLPPRRPPKKIS
eukprot:364441-Chlamydomonas_euryale.AAC.2